MSFGSDGGEFRLAYVVAFQHAIDHTIPGGNGLHDFGADDARAVAPRTSTHAFHYRRTARVKRHTRPELTVRSGFG
jgi:hypothetical protein